MMPCFYLGRMTRPSTIFSCLTALFLSACQPPASRPPSNSTSAEVSASAISEVAETGAGNSLQSTDTAQTPVAEDKSPDPVESTTAQVAPETPLVSQTDQEKNETTFRIERGDWAQWGGNSLRNNTPVGKNIPSEWDIGSIDRRTGEWNSAESKNIKWVARVGSQTYGNPVVADGKVYVGTNNAAGYLSRYPGDVDLGCLICFRESDGKFLWQHSSEKLSSGRVHDWPLQGICCAPLVDGDRLWFVSSRGHVVCVDTQGYYDGEDDGPIQNELARLFKENPSLTAGLDDGYMADSLRAIITEREVDFSGRLRVETIESGQRWNLRVKSRDATIYYDLQLQDNQLHFSSTESNEPEAEGSLLFKVAATLDAGLNEGQVSEVLRTFSAARGFACNDNATVTVEKPDQSWNITAGVEGETRQLRLRRTGPTLTAWQVVTSQDKQEADTVWTYDMMSQLRVSQHNMCSCSVTALGDILFVNTSNGVDETHKNIPSVTAPSFMAMNKHTGEVYWTDSSPGSNILHGQWSSPTVGIIHGEPQVIFAGGDGWVYSFRADEGVDGKPELLWKFDANPKTSEWKLRGNGTRNNIIATPVIYQDLLYVAVGQDPEHGEGNGHLWCIDPSKRGDVSSELAVKVNDRKTSIPHRRIQAVIEEEGEIAIDNPNSAVVWHYDSFDQNGDGEIEFHEEIHRSCGTVTIKDDILYIADFSGIFHCLHALTGQVHWTYDMFSQAWGSSLVVEGKVFIGDEEGDIAVFPLTADRQKALIQIEEDEWQPALGEIKMENSVYSTPIIANDVLFIANRTHLFAISYPGEDQVTLQNQP